MTFGKIGARRMMKTFYTARDYVQDGLIAMWDGIENAGWGMHDPNATVWKDLIGNYDATRRNAKWGDSYAIIEGPNDVAMTGSLLGMPPNLSVEIVYKPHVLRNDTNYTYCGCANNGGWAIKYEKGIAKYFAMGYSYPLEVRSDIDVINTIYYKAMTIGAQLRAFKNGTLIATGGNGSAVQYSATTGFNIGADGGTSALISEQSMVGNVYAVRVCNRLLEDAEIAHNYTVDKLRFNLP